MADSATEICNLALSHLGSGHEIADIDNEEEVSDEKSACLRYYDTALKQTLRAFHWPFAKKIAELTEVEEDPTDEWAYSYALPSDCLSVRRILSGQRNEYRQSRVPYHIGHDETHGRLIFTDMDEAEAEYTALIETESFYPDDFVMAFSFLLAFYIANRVVAGDNRRRTAMWESYQIELAQARAASANEEQVDEEVASEFVRGRD
jgi:hypothetical protein